MLFFPCRTIGVSSEMTDSEDEEGLCLTSPMGVPFVGCPIFNALRNVTERDCFFRIFFEKSHLPLLTGQHKGMIFKLKCGCSLISARGNQIVGYPVFSFRAGFSAIRYCDFSYF